MFPSAKFVKETGNLETYGEVGTWTATTGPDMQADVVGVFVPKDIDPFCSIITRMYTYEWSTESTTSDIDRWEKSQSSQSDTSS
jgi:hypothetical protein